MYPVIEDERGRNWRQVQLRLGPKIPYDYSSVTWRVVAWWEPCGDVQVFNFSRSFHCDLYELHPLCIDLAPHRAFVRGEMPASVYADWLEENLEDFPAMGLSLLRGWILEGVVVNAK